MNTNHQGNPARQPHQDGHPATTSDVSSLVGLATVAPYPAHRGAGDFQTVFPLASFVTPTLEAAGASATTAPFEQSCERSIDLKTLMKFGSSTQSPLNHVGEPSFVFRSESAAASSTQHPEPMTPPSAGASNTNSNSAPPFVPAAAFRLGTSDASHHSPTALAVSGTGSKTSESESAAPDRRRLKRRSQVGGVSVSGGAGVHSHATYNSNDSPLDHINNDDPLQLAGVPTHSVQNRLHSVPPVSAKQNRRASHGGSSSGSFDHHEADQPYVAATGLGSSTGAGADVSSLALLASDRSFSQHLMGSGYDTLSQQNNLSTNNPILFTSNNQFANIPSGTFSVPFAAFEGNRSPLPQPSSFLSVPGTNWIPTTSQGSGMNNGNNGSMSVGGSMGSSGQFQPEIQTSATVPPYCTTPSPYSNGTGGVAVDDDQFMVTSASGVHSGSLSRPQRNDSGTPPTNPLVRGASSGNFSSASGDSFAHLSMGPGGYVHPIHFSQMGAAVPMMANSVAAFVPTNIPNHPSPQPVANAAPMVSRTAVPDPTYANGSMATQHFLRQTGGVLGNNRYESLEVQAHKAASAELVAACLYAGTARYNFTVEAPRGLVKLYPPAPVVNDTDDFAGSSRATDTLSRENSDQPLQPPSLPSIASSQLSENQQRQYLESQATNIAMTAGGTTALPLPSVPVTMVSVSRHIVSYFMQKPQDRLSWTERRKRLDGLQSGCVKKRPVFGVDPTADQQEHASTGGVAESGNPLSRCSSDHSKPSRPTSPNEPEIVFIEADPPADLTRVIVPARYLMDEDDLTLSTVHDRNATENALRRWELLYGPLCEPTVGFMRYKSQLWWLRKRFELESLNNEQPLPPSTNPPPRAPIGALPDVNSNNQAAAAAARTNADLSASGTLSFSVAVCASFNTNGKCEHGSQCEMVHIRWGALMRYVEHTAEKTFRNSAGNENVILTAAKTRVPPLIMAVDAHLHPFLTRRKGKLPYVRSLPAHTAEAMHRLHNHFGMRHLKLYEDPSVYRPPVHHSVGSLSNKPSMLAASQVHTPDNTNSELSPGVHTTTTNAPSVCSFTRGATSAAPSHQDPNTHLPHPEIITTTYDLTAQGSVDSLPPAYTDVVLNENEQRQVSSDVVPSTSERTFGGLASPLDDFYADPTANAGVASTALTFGDSLSARRNFSTEIQSVGGGELSHKRSVADGTSVSGETAAPLAKSVNSDSGNWAGPDAAEITGLKVQRNAMLKYPRDVESNPLNFVSITAYIPSGIEGGGNGNRRGGGGGSKNEQRHRSRQVLCPVEDIILTKGARLVLERKPGAPVKPLLCSHFEQGLCTRGTACMFIHYYNTDAPHPLSGTPHLHITEDDERYDYLTQNQRTGDVSAAADGSLVTAVTFGNFGDDAGSVVFPPPGHLTTSASLVEDTSATTYLPPTKALPSDLTTLLSTAGSGYSRQQQIRQITQSALGSAGPPPSHTQPQGWSQTAAQRFSNHNNNGRNNNANGGAQQWQQHGQAQQSYQQPHTMMNPTGYTMSTQSAPFVPGMVHPQHQQQHFMPGNGHPNGSLDGGNTPSSGRSSARPHPHPHQQQQQYQQGFAQQMPSPFGMMTSPNNGSSLGVMNMMYNPMAAGGVAPIPHQQFMMAPGGGGNGQPQRQQQHLFMPPQPYFNPSTGGPNGGNTQMFNHQQQQQHHHNNNYGQYVGGGGGGGSRGGGGGGMGGGGAAGMYYAGPDPYAHQQQQQQQQRR